MGFISLSFRAWARNLLTTARPCLRLRGFRPIPRIAASPTPLPYSSSATFLLTREILHFGYASVLNDNVASAKVYFPAQLIVSNPVIPSHWRGLSWYSLCYTCTAQRRSSTAPCQRARFFAWGWGPFNHSGACTPQAPLPAMGFHPEPSLPLNDKSRTAAET